MDESQAGYTPPTPRRVDHDKGIFVCADSPRSRNYKECSVCGGRQHPRNFDAVHFDPAICNTCAQIRRDNYEKKRRKDPVHIERRRACARREKAARKKRAAEIAKAAS